MESLATVASGRRAPFVLSAVWIALLGAAYSETFHWMGDRWLAPGSYYSHGFIVPFVSLWLVWRQRQALKALPLSPSRRGWLWIGIALSIHLTSLFLRVHFTSGVTLPLVLYGAVLYLLGREHARRLRLAILFLFFMIPLPMALIEKMAFQLKMVATDLSVAIAGAVGWAEASRGSTIFLPSGETLVVGDVCSGLRSLIALLTLGFLFATTLSKLSMPRKVVLFALSVPIAIVSNIVRLVVLCGLGHYAGAEFAAGPAHYAAGFGIYVVALALLFGAEQLLAGPKRRKERA